MNLAKYSLDNTKIIYFFLAVLLIGGITSFGKLGKKEDAPFVIKSAVIMTRYPGAEPAEVERLITEPISREIQSMSGVYKIKSESMYGLSKITFELQPSLSASSIPQKWLDMPISFTSTGIKEALNQPHKYLLEKNEAVRYIKSLLEKGNYVRFDPDVKDNQMVKGYHYYKIEINNEPSYVVIRELKTGELMFYSIVEKIKKKE